MLTTMPGKKIPWTIISLMITVSNRNIFK